MKENKKVLIITYYWPPSGGAGVQRWLKFTKYLPKYGWDPIIFTPENPQFDLKDESLIKEISPDVDVLKFPIWEPYGLFKKLTGTKEVKQGQVLEDRYNSPLKKISIFIRGNLFIPDPRRFWVKPSVNYLQEILQTNEIKHVITTGPPHSVHLIGLKLKYKNPSLHWLADFRDPWTEWDIMKKFNMVPWVRKRHQKLESEVLKVADVTLATGEQAANDFKRLGARRTAVFTNGFDQEPKPKPNSPNAKPLKMLHLGMLNEKRSPLMFFEQLDKLVESDPKVLRLNFTGIISDVVMDQVKALKALSGVINVKPSVDYSELNREYEEADILLLLQTDSKESKTQLPGKLFEYLAQRKPILAFGDPESNVAQILKETKSGVMISYSDDNQIHKIVSELKEGTFGNNFEFVDIEAYSRENITIKLAALLGELD